MSTVAVSPLRQRMIEDMNARKLCAGTQRGHIHSCKRFAAFLKRSPDTATAEDIRRFHPSNSIPNRQLPCRREEAFDSALITKRFFRRRSAGSESGHGSRACHTFGAIAVL